MVGLASVAIIGGSGIGERLATLGGEPILVPTKSGPLRGRLIRHRGIRILAIQRHAAGHRLPPHRVPYSAMALGVKAAGIPFCISTAAVGSLRPEWNPGTLVVCSDFYDFTCRNITLFDDEVVHRDFSEPFSPRVRQGLLDSAAETGHPIVDGGIYQSNNGPRYESPEEIRLYQRLGSDLVGMTASSEAVVFREAEIEYGCLAIVTNLAAGISPTPLDHAEVLDQMRRSGEAAVDILLRAAHRLAESS